MGVFVRALFVVVVWFVGLAVCLWLVWLDLLVACLVVAFGVDGGFGGWVLFIVCLVIPVVRCN